MARIAVYTQAYNSEKYLRKCIESVIHQTFADIEYYIADNGSTDGTRGIIREYAGMDHRIKPIYIDTNSLVGTYNSSFKKIYAAKHEFLCVLDPDDWYEPRFAEAVLAALDDARVDFVLCASHFISEDTGAALGVRGCESTVMIPRGMAAKNFPSLYPFYRTLWAKVYRIRILKDHAIYLSSEIDYGNDTLLILEYLKHVNGIAAIKEPLYNYLVRTASDSSRYRPGIFNDDLYLYRKTLEYLHQEQGCTENNRIFAAIVYFNAVLDGIQMFLTGVCSKREKILRISAVFTNNAIPEIWETITNSSPEYQNIYGLDEFSEKIKSSLFNALTVIFDPSCSREVFQVIAFLCPGINDFWDFHSAESWMAAGPVECNFILGNFEAACFLLKEMPDAGKSAFHAELEAYLTAILPDERSCLAAVYMKWHSIFTEKQVRYLFSGNEILRSVDRCESLHAYPAAVSCLLSGNYPKATKLLFESLDVEEDLPVDLVAVLDQALLYAASITMDSDKYVYAKKVQALVALEKGDRETYEDIMGELGQMGQ